MVKVFFPSGVAAKKGIIIVTVSRKTSKVFYGPQDWPKNDQADTESEISP